VLGATLIKFCEPERLMVLHMSFASDVKNEICKIPFDDICCTRAEITGIVCFAAQINADRLKINTENGMVANRIYELIKRLYNLKIDVVMRKSGAFSAQMGGMGTSDVLKILRDMRLSTVPIRIDKEIIRRECCKRAFIRGAFLGGGSISAPEKGYHTEIVTNHYGLCSDFKQLLGFFEIYSKIVKRKGNYVFYLKDSEQIEDLLAVLGAHIQMMEFLNIKIVKEVRNTTNRLVNCETANVEKTASAAVQQKMAILTLKRKLGFEHLSPELTELAKLRLKNPEATLTELSKMLGITKSGVNHRMRRLIKMAEAER